MIKLNVSGHGELCGGYSYSGTASFDGTSVKEIHVDGGWYCFYDFNIITEDK